MFFSQANTNISNNDFSSSQAKRVKVVTRLKDFSGRRRPVSLQELKNYKKNEKHIGSPTSILFLIKGIEQSKQQRKYVDSHCASILQIFNQPWWRASPWAKKTKV